MNFFCKLLLIIFLFSSFNSILLAENKFYEEGKKKYIEKNYEDSKFLFQRSIVFNPKDTNSYLYLAKIFNKEKNKKEEEKNINTALLIEPTNEEALYMLMEIELKKSNYSKVEELIKNFSKVCKILCEKTGSISEALKNLEPKNES